MQPNKSLCSKAAASVLRAKKFIHKRTISELPIEIPQICILPKTQTQTPRSISSQVSAKNSVTSFFSAKNLEVKKKILVKIQDVVEDCKLLSPKSAINVFREFLNEFEQKEIKRFKHVYYVKREFKAVSENFSDAEGGYLMEIGDSICYRYEVVQVLGSGVFGQVVKCMDHKMNEFVAIKVLRRTHTSKNQGLSEYKFSHLLNSASQSSCIVQVKRKFEFRFHFFIVFELLGCTLREFIQINSFQGIPSTLVKRLTSQLLLALSHMHSLHIIHCDLKPDNIAFKHSNKSSIRVFDFGSSCLETNTIFTYIQSRYYRAPEIVLQVGKYNTAIDMWSLGCVVAEMLLGEPLFKGKNEQELIKSMVRILGSPPEELVVKAKAKNLLENCKDGNKLSFYFAKFGTGVIEFLQGCFKWNPNERMTAKEGIKAKWFLVKQTKSGEKIKKSRC